MSKFLDVLEDLKQVHWKYAIYTILPINSDLIFHDVLNTRIVTRMFL